MSEAAIAKKAEEVKSVNAQLLAAESAIVVDYRGLTVEEVTDLRKQLRDANIKMSVIKNKILTRAVEAADLTDLNDLFVGPSAVAFSNEDAIAPSRILKKFADNIEALEIKGGVVDGQVASVEDINKYAALPDRDGLLSMLLSTLQAPVRNFAYAVKAVSDAKEEAAEA